MKGSVISKHTVVMHRWENTLAKYRVLLVTCDHALCLRLPLFHVFTNITTEERALSPTLICLLKIAHTVLTIWFFLLIFYAPGCGVERNIDNIADSMCMSYVSLSNLNNSGLSVEKNGLCLI